MSIAFLYPEAPMGRGAEDEARKSVETADISIRRLQQARQVLRHSPVLARQVITSNGRPATSRAQPPARGPILILAPAREHRWPRPRRSALGDPPDRPGKGCGQIAHYDHQAVDLGGDLVLVGGLQEDQRPRGPTRTDRLELGRAGDRRAAGQRPRHRSARHAESPAGSVCRGRPTG